MSDYSDYILWELIMGDQSEQTQLEAVKINGKYLEYCINPSEKVQLEALRSLHKASYRAM